MLRFRWGTGLTLPEIAPVEQLPGRTYRLKPHGRDSEPLHHARSVRAIGKGVAVHYYFGARGWEFDIEKEPDTPLPELRLESLDAPWKLDAEGNLRIDGQPWIKHPVAYTEDALGNRSLVRAHYRLLTAHAAVIETGEYDPAHRLVIDPVLTYATYFAGTDEEAASFVEELADGSVMLAGNTRSSDLPEGILLNSLADPTANRQRDCFVARIVPAEKRIDTVSYFGTTGFEDCRAIRRDGSGRIVMAGVADGSPGLATADAESPTARGFVPTWFLARISSSLRRIEYATYLEPLSPAVLMATGQGDSVYLATETSAEPPGVAGVPAGFRPSLAGGTDVLLMRYDIALRRYTARTYIGGSLSETLSGISTGPNGAIMVFGTTASGNLALSNPVQTAGPLGEGPQNLAAYIATLSADLRTLSFASYLGGQSQVLPGQIGGTNIFLAAAGPGGSIRVTGMTSDGSIPGLTPLQPFPAGESIQTGLFSLELTPGQTQLRNAFFAGKMLTEPPRAGFYVQDGRYCFLASGQSSLAFPGSALITTGSTAVMLGCVRADGTLDVLTPATAFHQSSQTYAGAPSQRGGAWVLHVHGRGGFGDVVPYDLKSTAIQPMQPQADSDDLVLRHLDLGILVPEVTVPVRIEALTGDRISNATIVSAINVAGRNFTSGMRLEVESLRFNLVASQSTAASVTYSDPIFVPAGVYSGRLVIPREPPMVSQPFTVTIANRAPASRPVVPAAVTATSAGVRFTINGPVYASTRVTWRGRPISTTPIAGPPLRLAVDIPAGELSEPGSGEFVIINPPPGGGVQRQTIIIGVASEPPLDIQLYTPVVTVTNSSAQSLEVTYLTDSIPLGACSAFWNGSARLASCGGGLLNGRGTLRVQLTAGDLTTPGVRDLQILVGQRRGPVWKVWVGLPAVASKIDAARKLLYTIDSAPSGEWRVSAWQLPGSQLLRSSTFSRGGASNVLDFQLSTDGSSILLVDDRRHVQRRRAADFTLDYEFDVAAAPFNLDVRLLPIPGSADSLVLRAPDGNLLIYDRDRPRPYTSASFPPSIPMLLHPVLVTGSVVYSVAHDDVSQPKPCLLRSPFDLTGFGQPEQLCNLQVEWGRYPEMHRYGSRLTLEADGAGTPVRATLDGRGSLLDAALSIVPANDWLLAANLTSYDFSTRNAIFQLAVSSLRSGEPIGHFPAAGILPFVSVVGNVDGTMVLSSLSSQLVFSRCVLVVPDWINLAEVYSLASSPPAFLINPASLSFNHQTGGAAPAAQSVSVTSPGAGFAYTAATNMPWLSVTPANANAPGQLSVSVNPTALAAGVYSGVITLTAPGIAPVTIPVSLTVSPQAPPSLRASPALLTFFSAGAAPQPQVLSIATPGGQAPLSSLTVSGGSWLSTGPSGLSANTFHVSVNPSGISPGVYSATIHVAATGANAVQVPVTLTITGASSSDSRIVPASKTAMFHHTIGSASPPAQTIPLTVAPEVGAFLSVSTNSQGWLSARLEQQTTPLARLILTPNTAGMTAGIYSGLVTLTSFSGSTIIPVQLIVSTTPAPPPPLSSRFVPLPPCRIIDTRLPVGPFGGPAIQGGATRNIAIPGSVCGIPSNAAAYSLNATVVPSGPLSYLTLWPMGKPQPLVSTLNAFDGSVTSNAAIVPAGANGSISAYVTDRSDLILDINGYFTSVPSSQSLVLYPVAPCRVADTRLTTGVFGGPTMQGGTTRDFPIPLSNCGVPAGAQAYSLNMTVVPVGPLAFLTTHPAGQSRPNVSTLNSFNGEVKANAAIVPAGTGGAVSVFVTDRTDVVIDINGYFAPPGGNGGLQFYPVTPCRVMDTRSTSSLVTVPLAGSTVEIPVPFATTDCVVPMGAAAYSTNVTAIPATALSYLTMWPTGSAQPLVSTLNSFTGRIVANAAIIPAGISGLISVYVTNSSYVVLDLNGFFAP